MYRIAEHQVFAEKYFRGQNPVGRHFTLGGTTNATDVEIVGIARTARYSSLIAPEVPLTSGTSLWELNGSLG